MKKLTDGELAAREEAQAVYGHARPEYGSPAWLDAIEQREAFAREWRIPTEQVAV